MATHTHPFASELINTLPTASWLETVRRDFGLDEESDIEPILCLSLLQKGQETRPIALVLEPGQAQNIVTVVAEFLRQSLRAEEAVMLVDFLPAVDCLGGGMGGCARRWVVDFSNAQSQLLEIAKYAQAATQIEL